MRKLTFASGWRGRDGTACTQAVGHLPAWMSQRPATLSSGHQKSLVVGISLPTELASAEKRHGGTDLRGMELETPARVGLPLGVEPKGLMVVQMALRL